MMCCASSWKIFRETRAHRSVSSPSTRRCISFSSDRKKRPRPVCWSSPTSTVGQTLTSQKSISSLDVHVCFFIAEPFLPVPDGLLTSLNSRRESISELLDKLPTIFKGSHDTSSALGAAMQVSLKLMVKNTLSNIIEEVISFLAWS